MAVPVISDRDYAVAFVRASCRTPPCGSRIAPSGRRGALERENDMGFAALRINDRFLRRRARACGKAVAHRPRASGAPDHGRPRARRRNCWPCSTVRRRRSRKAEQSPAGHRARRSRPQAERLGPRRRRHARSPRRPPNITNMAPAPACCAPGRGRTKLVRGRGRGAAPATRWRACAPRHEPAKIRAPPLEKRLCASTQERCAALSAPDARRAGRASASPSAGGVEGPLRRRSPEPAAAAPRAAPRANRRRARRSSKPA